MSSLWDVCSLVSVLFKDSVGLMEGIFNIDACFHIDGAKCSRVNNSKYEPVRLKRTAA